MANVTSGVSKGKNGKKVRTTTKNRVAVDPAPYYRGPEGERLFRAMNASLQKAVQGNYVLFRTEIPEAFQHYLECFLDPAERQFHNCHCCRSFLQRYAGLVTISAAGNVNSALWNRSILGHGIPDSYRAMVGKMKEWAETQAVVDQFLWNPGFEQDLGRDHEGGFSHFHVRLEAPKGYGELLTQGQAMAAKREDRKHLATAVVEMDQNHVRTAVRMLEAGGLERADTLLPMGKFLLSVQEAVSGVGTDRRNRLLWYYVGQAAP